MNALCKLLTLSVAAFALAGCASGMSHSQSLTDQEVKMLHNPSVIPNAAGPKLYTTNKHGNTTNGMGTSVYSMIGSSSLHSNGFSAHLESRLSGLGISDVRVFVFDDTVVLATDKLTASGAEYDNVQKKLLSQTEGMSAKGYSPDNGLGGISRKDTGKHDNLSMATSQIKKLMGAEVKVMTVTGAEAVQAIEKIRTDALAEDMSPGEVATGIKDLLELVKAGERKSK